MNARVRRFATALALPAALVLAMPQASRADSAMEEVLSILKKEGIIDQGQQDRLMAKYQDEQKKSEDKVSGLLDGMQWYGDLRLRYETFWFDDDATGNESDNRYRFRYRARFGFKRNVGDRIQVGVRLATTGLNDSQKLDADPRSTNVTLGGNRDFAPDGILFDQAWVALTLQESGDLRTTLVGGKVSNPYTWKNGKDFLVFDGDLNMEGAYLTSSYEPSEDTTVFGTFGTFVVKENSSNADPKLFALQAGVETELGAAKVGFRASGYEWRSLDDGFLSNAFSQGNLPSAYDSRARMGDVFAYAKFGGGSWPVMLYGTAVRNFSADSAVLNGISVGKEDDAYGIGIEVGDSKKFVELGFGWFHVEANSVPGQIYDSDLFDGKTNREGIIFYASRRLLSGTDFNLTYFDGKEIEDDGGASGPFNSSLADADRRRLQADVIVKF